jgi:hypothetical protein
MLEMVATTMRFIMCFALRHAGGIVALSLAVASVSGHAEVPACTAATLGQSGWQAGVRCSCRFFVASGLAGTPAGYRWDCGILKARANQAVPATANPYPYPLPGALSLDRTVVLQGGAIRPPGD